MNEKWFSMSVGDVEKKLKTNAASGLSRKAARSAWYRGHAQDKHRRILFFKRRKPFGRMLGDIFADFALVIMLLAATFAIVLNEGLVGITVITILFIGLAVSLLVYFISQRTMEQMNLYFLPTAKVIRGGKLYRISFDNVVEGDVIIFEKGDIVPADARLVTSDKLSVSMRIDKSKYIFLQKQAQGVVFEGETNPAKMSNILHAGSVIEEGSARAVVYAIGLYTYLGARTGGIPVLYSDNIPRELKKMKKICSQINLFSMICILPLCIISVFVAHANGGNATLSNAFLTALAISASSLTQLSTTVCKVFFVNKIKQFAHDKNRAIIRTTEAFDNFCDIKYLFMLDGSAVTDGILHFDTAFTLDGDIKNYQNAQKTNKVLFDAVGLYNLSQVNALTLGLSSTPDRFRAGIDEFLRVSSTDTEALKIKYAVNAYINATITQPTDRVYCSEGNTHRVLDISRSSDILSCCSHALVGGHAQPLSTVGRDKLFHKYNFHAEKGKTILIFTAAPKENNVAEFGKLFLGALVLREGIDKRAFSAISTLEKQGVKVISFSGKKSDASVPQIPTELHRDTCAYKSDFENNHLPLSYNFGVIDTYYGFAEDDICELLKHAHSHGDSVGVVAFSDFAPAVLENCDVFISCAEVVNFNFAKSEQELYTLEIEGAASSSSCIQTVKSESDILIPRPNEKAGGIASLANIVFGAKSAYRNLNRFFKYVICVQLLRVITVGIPMFFGRSMLLAAHILFFSFIFDLFVLLMLAFDTKHMSSIKISQYKIKDLKTHLLSFRRLLACVAVVGLIAIVLPQLMSSIGIFGPYLYTTEYLFCTVLWLHLIIAFYMRHGTLKNIKKLTHDIFFIALIIFVCVFVILLFAVNSFGLLFGFITNPAPYFIASFIPALLFCALMEFLPTIKKDK